MGDIRPIFQLILVKLQAFGKFFTDMVVKVGRENDKEATGGTFKSFSQAVTVNTRTAVQLDVSGSKVFEYIESGRPAGSKLPPQGVLIDWMNARGIPLDREFVIRRSIAVNGIKPFPLIELSLKQVQDDFDAKLLSQIADNINIQLNQQIQRNFKFPNGEIKLT